MLKSTYMEHFLRFNTKKPVLFITSLVLLLILLLVYIDAKADTPPTNCIEYFAQGKSNIPSDDPSYTSKLDRDNDGIMCER